MSKDSGNPESFVPLFYSAGMIAALSAMSINLTFPPAPSHAVQMFVSCATVCMPCTVRGPRMADKNGPMRITGVDFDYELQLSS